MLVPAFYINYIQLPYSTIIFVGDWHEILSTQGPRLAAHSMLIGSFWGRISQIRRTSVTSVHFSRLWVKSLWEWTVLGIYPWGSFWPIPSTPSYMVFYDILYAGFGTNSDVFTTPCFWNPTKQHLKPSKGMLIWVAFNGSWVTTQVPSCSHQHSWDLCMFISPKIPKIWGVPKIEVPSGKLT